VQRQPVVHEIDARLAVADVTVPGPALFDSEDLDRPDPGADRFDRLLQVFHARYPRS
jgi:hypothetical protein